MLEITLNNAAAHVITVTSTATLLSDLINTAAGSKHSYPAGINAVELYIEDGGNVRMLADGNTPTAANGVMLKENAYYSLRGVDFKQVRLIAVSDNVTVNVRIGIAGENDQVSTGAGLGGVPENYPYKRPVVAATTTNGTLATAFANGQTIDGITLATGDRILIKDQTDQKVNGIYIVQASGAPVRADDADKPAELNGAVVAVLGGTVNADTMWMQLNDITAIGTDNIQWGDAGGYVGGTGITIVGVTINNDLSTGVSGGQSVVGGTDSGDDLTLVSTSDATKGSVLVDALDISPLANDQAALGTTSLGWSDLHLATGATINVANGDWVGTHSPGILTISTGDLRVDTAGTNTASVVTVGGTQTLTSKSLTSPAITGAPTASGATWASLGTVTTIDINGGTIDGTVIGASTRAAGSFTTLSAKASSATLVTVEETTNTNQNPALAFIKNRGGAGAIASSDGDLIGTISASFYNDNATPELIGNTFIYAVVDDVSDGTEDTSWHFSTLVAGTQRETLLLKDGFAKVSYPEVAGTNFWHLTGENAINAANVRAGLRLKVNAANSASVWMLAVNDGSGGGEMYLGTETASTFTTRLYLAAGTAVQFQTITTTASAANAFLDSGNGNNLLRSTSSTVYKKDIETLEDEYADKLLGMRPVWYRSKCENDRDDWSWYGLIAEEVAELDPRLVNWGYHEEDLEDVEEIHEEKVTNEDGETEIIEKKFTTRKPKEGAELKPDGVQYERLTVGLLSIVQRQQAKLEALEARLDALEAKK